MMTVGDLRKALENVPDNLEVLVFAFEESEMPGEDTELVCPLVHAEVEEHQGEGPYLALYGNGDELEEEETADNEDGENEDNETETPN